MFFFFKKFSRPQNRHKTSQCGLRGRGRGGYLSSKKYSQSNDELKNISQDQLVRQLYNGDFAAVKGR